MGETKSTARMTITMPAVLKEEMESVKDEVNWSGVAAEAFRGKLLELTSQRKGTTMTEVIERMKAAEELERNHDYAEGKKAGTTWAQKTATPKQLRRLEQEYNPSESLTGEPNAFGWAGVVFWLIFGDVDHRNELNDFWESTLGENDSNKINEVSFAEGFIDGAIEVWEAVKHKL